MNKIVILLCLFLISCANELQPSPKIPAFDCKPEQRNADVCISLYEPVCGWFDESIKCIKYPCATTYSNSCVACRDDKVISYTNGGCPE